MNYKIIKGFGTPERKNMGRIPDVPLEKMAIGDAILAEPSKDQKLYTKWTGRLIALTKRKNLKTSDFKLCVQEKKLYIVRYAITKMPVKK